MSDEAPLVTLFSLGGTIAMTSAATGGVQPTLSASTLISTIPGLEQTGIAIEAVDFRQLPGASLTFADLDELLAAVNRTLDGGATGVVIVEGTDPIEEVAYYLDLRHTAPNPVVVTGAMRNPTMAAPDGPANLLASIIVAATPTSRERGVLVVMNDEIHAAVGVRKTHSTSTAAFQSPNTGPVGLLVEGSPRWFSGPPVRHTVAGIQGSHAPRVALHTITLNDDPDLLAGIHTRADGLIVAGMGVGHVPLNFVDVLGQAATHIPVVLTTRTGRGPSLTQTYGFPGSERDLLWRGLISGGFLDPLKARILLHALLTAGASRSEIVEAFTAAGNG